MTRRIMILKLALIFSMVINSQLVFATFEYKEHMIARLLISEEAMEIKVAGKILEEIVNPNVDLTDLAALRLLQNYSSQEKNHIDANAWLIRALKQSKNKRYLKLLTNIRSNTDNDKLLKYLNGAIPNLTEGNDDNSINTDSINYTELSESILQSLSIVTFSYGHIDSVVQGETIKEVYNKLGYPSEVSFYIHSKRIPFVGRVKLQDALLIYEGSGSIKLRSLGGDQLVYTTEPEKQPSVVAEELNSILGHATAERTRILAKQLYKNKDYNHKLLDAAANKAWVERNSQDPIMADSVAWLCRFIGDSKNPRYYNLMKQLVGSTENKKILKYAKKSLSLLPNDDKKNGIFSPAKS